MAKFGCKDSVVSSLLLLLLACLYQQPVVSESSNAEQQPERPRAGGLRRRQTTDMATSTTNSSTAMQTSYRIVGGQAVPPGKYPFMAELEKGCGASLIAPDILLSAAHCEPLAQKSEYAYIGSNFLKQGTPRRIEQVIPHPDYDEYAATNDFLILTLDRPIEGIEPVTLNDDTSIPGIIELRKQTQRGRGRQSNVRNNKNNDYFFNVGDLLTVIGFGVTEEGATTQSETLQEVNVAYVPHRTCQEWYKNEIVDEATMFCAGFEHGERGTFIGFFCVVLDAIICYSLTFT